MLADILMIAGGVLAGLIAALTVIAPRTKTKVDDEILEDAKEAKKILDVVEGETQQAEPKSPATPGTPGK